MNIKLNNNINVCILLPGFIKSYNHLNYLNTLFNKINANKIYVFGHIFNYMIDPKCHKDTIDYSNKKKNYLDKNKLNIFDSFQYVSDNYEKYDKDGYDNRIYSQWYNIKQSFELYLNFSKKNNVKCDIFIRMRSDLQITDVHRLNTIIQKSLLENNLIFFTPSCHIVNDQFFIGPFEQFKKIMLLSDNIYNYYLLDEIKERIIKHKNNKNKPNYNKYLRFECESEILLWIHLKKHIHSKNLLLMENKNLFYIKTSWRNPK